MDLSRHCDGGAVGSVRRMGLMHKPLPMSLHYATHTVSMKKQNRKYAPNRIASPPCLCTRAVCPLNVSNHTTFKKWHEMPKRMGLREYLYE